MRHFICNYFTLLESFGTGASPYPLYVHSAIVQNESEAIFFTRLVTVVIAIRTQYHFCCYQNRFTIITNTLALALPRILEDVNVLMSCHLQCETPQHKILSVRVHYLDLAAGAIAIYCCRKDSDHRGLENGVSTESVVRMAVRYRMYTDLPDRCSILSC